MRLNERQKLAYKLYFELQNSFEHAAALGLWPLAKHISMAMDELYKNMTKMGFDEDFAMDAKLSCTVANDTCMKSRVYLDTILISTNSCLYCGGNCPEEPCNSLKLCDGFAGDIDGLYS